MSNLSLVFEALTWSGLAVFLLWTYRTKNSGLFVAVFFIYTKSVYTFANDSFSAEYIFHSSCFVITIAALYFVRKNKNFRNLLGLLLLIKFLDVAATKAISEYSSVALYSWAVLMDLLAIAAIYRDQISLVLAPNNAPHSHSLSLQEKTLVWIYGASAVVSIAMTAEQLIRDHSEFFPLLVYNMYPSVKLGLTFGELLLLFCIATGGALFLNENKKYTVKKSTI